MVSLSLGNPGFPLGNSLPYDVEPYRHFLLAHSFLLAVFFDVFVYHICTVLSEINYILCLPSGQATKFNISRIRLEYTVEEIAHAAIIYRFTNKIYRNTIKNY